jgi:thiamine-monophosphate kinase
VRLDEAGEFGLLAELERRGLALGIEHDAAQIEGLVVTQDALVEGVHFRFDLVSWRDLGFRAAAANLSDLAASGADPLALIVTLGLPGETHVADVVELYEGLNEPGVPVRGGDTSRAQSVVLSVTAIGRSARVPGRAGAKPGDLLVVTGPLAARSACRLTIELERVPLSDGAMLEDVGFGEDYELLAATPDALDFTVIGRCEEGSGVVVTLHGKPVELAGWEHFV